MGKKKKKHHHKFYKFDGDKYYYHEKAWYRADTNIKVHSELGHKLSSRFFKPSKNLIKLAKLMRERPLMSEGESVITFSAGLPGGGKKR